MAKIYSSRKAGAGRAGKRVFRKKVSSYTSKKGTPKTGAKMETLVAKQVRKIQTLPSPPSGVSVSTIKLFPRMVVLTQASIAVLLALPSPLHPYSPARQ